jgi:hypothetical protein
VIDTKPHDWMFPESTNVIPIAPDVKVPVLVMLVLIVTVPAPLEASIVAESPVLG